MSRLSLVCTALAALAAVGCENKQEKVEASGVEAEAPKAAAAEESSPDPGEVPRVVVTTTMIEDLARQIGGAEVEVQGIMRPGGDPHLHQATPSDAKMVAKSDLVLTNGLYLEGWLDDLVRNAGGERDVVEVSKGVDPITMEDSPGGVDPHMWFEVGNWKIAAQNVVAALEGVVPKDKHAGMRARHGAYVKKLDGLDAWVREQLATIPEGGRVLITSHDAFNYFERAYGLKVVGIQGASTEQEAGQRDVANTIELVKKHGVGAVFVETSVNPALIERVSKETGVKVAGPLYSDSLGGEDSEANTYVGMVTENVRMIVEGLGGRYETFGAM
ncbi:MAG: zinc ABC transporter substrate-binding protein [Myxococcota bacterium]